MKWGNLFLIKLCPDKVINESAEVYREWEQVPDARKWSDPAADGWQELYRGCFNQSGIPRPTLADKLMIIAHGSTTHVGVESSALETPGGQGFDAHELVDWLVRWGITEVGLISFKCCYVGAGHFLENFVRHSAQKLRVGWVKGYKGVASTIKRDWIDTKFIGGVVGKPYESIGREGGVLAGVGLPLYGNDRFKIVPGNAAVDKLNSRYLLAQFRETGD